MGPSKSKSSERRQIEKEPRDSEGVYRSFHNKVVDTLFKPLRPFEPVTNATLVENSGEFCIFPLEIFMKILDFGISIVSRKDKKALFASVNLIFVCRTWFSLFIEELDFNTQLFWHYKCLEDMRVPVELDFGMTWKDYFKVLSEYKFDPTCSPTQLQYSSDLKSVTKLPDGPDTNMCLVTHVVRTGHAQCEFVVHRWSDELIFGITNSPSMKSVSGYSVLACEDQKKSGYTTWGYWSQRGIRLGDDGRDEATTIKGHEYRSKRGTKVSLGVVLDVEKGTIAFYVDKEFIYKSREHILKLDTNGEWHFQFFIMLDSTDDHVEVRSFVLDD